LLLVFLGTGLGYCNPSITLIFGGSLGDPLKMGARPIDQVFAPISELIDLARWIKFDPSFITWLVLIVLSGTEFNRRINFHPRYREIEPSINANRLSRNRGQNA